MKNFYESCLRFSVIVDETVATWGYGFEFVGEMEVIRGNLEANDIRVFLEGTSGG